MEILGGHQFQLIVSLVVVAGVACVALLCDFLKGNNEQLRELAVELKVRQEQMAPAAAMRAEVASSSRQAAFAEKQAAENAAAAESLERAVERVAERVEAAESETPVHARRNSRVAREADEAMKRGSELVAVRPRKNRVEATPAAAEAAMAELDIRVQRKAALKARLERPSELVEVAAATVVAEQVAVPERQEGAVVVMPEPKLSVDQKNLLDEILAATVANTTAPALHREQGRSRTAIRDDLFSSIGSRVNRLENTLGPTGSLSGVAFSEAEFVIDPSPSERLQRAIEATQNQAAGFQMERKPMPQEIPAGMQDGFVLSQLVQSRKPVSGLVVSIGVRGSDRKGGRMPEPVNDLMRSLLGSEDFGCQSASDEFLLIFPNDHGAASQRKLSAIAERLWDFQLRSMGSFSILFSWGGVEVNGESITEAISSASERMHQTQRNRKVATLGVPQHEMVVTEPAQKIAV